MLTPVERELVPPEVRRVLSWMHGPIARWERKPDPENGARICVFTLSPLMFVDPPYQH